MNDDPTNTNGEDNQMKAQDDLFSWLNRGRKINEELLQLSTEKVEEILCITLFLKHLQKLEDDANKGNLTPKDSENLKQLKNAKKNYSALLEQLKSLETSH
ncbi:MAG: hypothetical protein AB1589_19580 [Cyanobacteriota bacterium]